MNAQPPGRINLKHLHYFHEVAREGSLTGAARRLHLAPQTLSSQVRELERALGRTRLERHRDRIEIDCVEGAVTGLLGRLAAHQLDAVLADQPVPPHLARSMRGRLILKSGLSFVAAPRIRKALRGTFPACLDGAPFIAGSADSPLGIAINGWLAERGLAPHVVSRCDDSALIKVFAQRGVGVACVPTAIEPDVEAQFGLRLVGRVPELSEPLYLIRPAGRHLHPLLEEIEASA
jgi:LysR family transcriptional activator of nhaA